MNWKLCTTSRTLVSEAICKNSGTIKEVFINKVFFFNKTLYKEVPNSFYHCEAAKKLVDLNWEQITVDYTRYFNQKWSFVFYTAIWKSYHDVC